MASALGIPRTQPRWQEQAQSYLGQAGSTYSRMDRQQYYPEYEKSPAGALQSAASMGMAGMKVGTFVGGASAVPIVTGSTGGAGLGVFAGMGGAGEAGISSLGMSAAGMWGLGIGAAIGLGMYLFG